MSDPKLNDLAALLTHLGKSKSALRLSVGRPTFEYERNRYIGEVIAADGNRVEYGHAATLGQLLADLTSDKASLALNCRSGKMVPFNLAARGGRGEWAAIPQVKVRPRELVLVGEGKLEDVAPDNLTLCGESLVESVFAFGREIKPVDQEDRTYDLTLGDCERDDSASNHYFLPERVGWQFAARRVVVLLRVPAGVELERVILLCEIEREP